MKDKLRELAERWVVTRKTRSSYEDGCAYAKNACATELLAILDAEGDGGAVDRDVLAVGVRARNIEITRQQRAGEPNNEDHALRIGIAAALATYPARSGVVSDEDVEEFKAAMFPALENMKLCHIKDALEHFARRTP